MNKAIGGDGFPAELLKILKDDDVKVLYSIICQQIWKTQQWPEDWKITTLMEESKEALKSFLKKVKEENEKAGLKFNIQKTKILASSLITSW